MPNNVAKDENGNLIHSITIYNSQHRIEAREKTYHCIYCETKITYAHSGEVGCFRHLPSTPKDVKEGCPYYHGLLSGCSPEEARVIEAKKDEVQSFLNEKGIKGYKVISYYSEPDLVKFIKNHPNENFILVGNMLTEYEQGSLDYKNLILRKKAIGKYLASSNKPIIQAFAGTTPDKIYLMKYGGDWRKSEVQLYPYLISETQLKKKDFASLSRLMQATDIIEIRETEGKHNNRVLPSWMQS